MDERKLISHALRELARWDERAVKHLAKMQPTEGTVSARKTVEKRLADALLLAALIERADQIDLWT